MPQHPGSHKKKKPRRPTQRVNINPLTKTELATAVSQGQAAQGITPDRQAEIQAQAKREIDLRVAVMEQKFAPTLIAERTARLARRNQKAIQQSQEARRAFLQERAERSVPPLSRPTEAQIDEAVQQRRATRQPQASAPPETAGQPFFELPLHEQARLRQNPEAMQAALQAHRDQLRHGREDVIAAGSGGALQPGRQGGLVPTQAATDLAQRNLAAAGQREPLSAEEQKALKGRREEATGRRADQRAAADLRRGRILEASEPRTISDLLTARALERRDANLEAAGSIGQLRHQRHREGLQEGLIQAQIEQSRATQARALGRGRGRTRDPELEALTKSLEAAMEAGETERIDLFQRQILQRIGGAGIAAGGGGVEAGDQGRRPAFTFTSGTAKGKIDIQTGDGALIENVDVDTAKLSRSLEFMANKFAVDSKRVKIAPTDAAIKNLDDLEQAGQDIIAKLGGISDIKVRKALAQQLLSSLKIDAAQPPSILPTRFSFTGRRRDRIVENILDSLRAILAGDKPRRPSESK